MVTDIPTARARAKAILAQLNAHRRSNQPTQPERRLESLIDHAIALALAGDEQVAFEMFRAVPKAVARLTHAQVEGLLPTLYDWKSTDAFGSFVSGVAWREGCLTDRHVIAWAKSPNLWVRRAALVSTVPLNQPARGATAPLGEAKKTLAICTLLIDDQEDMIVKALSWALRVLAVKDSASARAFLDRHRERLAARVIRETTNKLSTGRKNPKGAARALATSQSSATPRTTRIAKANTKPNIKPDRSSTTPKPSTKSALTRRTTAGKPARPARPGTSRQS